ncbi:MAG: conserved hypothetical protein-putative tRNA adenylyltransferase, partial [uncultured Phycisphaerae bacterium]
GRCTNPQADRAARSAADVRTAGIGILHRQAQGGPTARRRQPVPPQRPPLQRRDPRTDSGARQPLRGRAAAGRPAGHAPRRAPHDAPAGRLPTPAHRVRPDRPRAQGLGRRPPPLRRPPVGRHQRAGGPEPAAHGGAQARAQARRGARLHPRPPARPLQLRVDAVLGEGARLHVQELDHGQSHRARQHRGAGEVPVGRVPGHRPGGRGRAARRPRRPLRAVPHAPEAARGGEAGRAVAPGGRRAVPQPAGVRAGPGPRRLRRGVPAGRVAARRRQGHRPPRPRGRRARGAGGDGHRPHGVPDRPPHGRPRLPRRLPRAPGQGAAVRVRGLRRPHAPRRTRPRRPAARGRGVQRGRGVGIRAGARGRGRLGV